MFVEKTNWIFIIAIFLVCLLFASPLIKMSIEEKKSDRRSSPSSITMFIVVMIFSLFLSLSLKETVRESAIMDYELKEPLSVSVSFGSKTKISKSKDSNGKRIYNDKSNKEKLETFNFNKGDKVKIKIMEEIEGFNIKNEKDWRNARVYILIEDNLQELSYDDIKKQEIDKLVKEMYEQ